jgi:hypothetical protein
MMNIRCPNRFRIALRSLLTIPLALLIILCGLGSSQWMQQAHAAPNAINNLKPIEEKDHILLSWTAPSDNGNAAAAYEIRYSYAAITESNWSQGAILPGAPVPAAPGAAQYLKVNGLSNSSTYYFAIKSKDASGSWSSISNVGSILPNGGILNNLMYLSAQADAHVADGASNNTNFGSASTANVQNDSTLPSSSWTYVKFDLTNAVNIQSAILRVNALHVVNLADEEENTVRFDVYSVSDVTWNESSITWTTKPALGTLLASGGVDEPTEKFYDIDVTSYIQAQKLAGATYVTLAITPTNDSRNTISLSTKEGASETQPLLAITSTANNAPEVVIDSPAADSTVMAGTVTINVTVTDPDSDSIVQVDFFDDNVYLGTDTTAPYSFTTSSLAANETHDFRVQATDARGAKTTQTISINTTSDSGNLSPNAPPKVVISGLLADSDYTTAAQAITMTAEVADADNAISKVEFFKNGLLAGTDTTAPYEFTYTYVASGIHTLTAKATDVRGASDTVSTKVIVNGSGFSTIRLNPTADSYVRSDDASSNFGSTPMMQSANLSNGTNMVSYMKFDISSATAVLGSAKLRFRANMATLGSANQTLNISSVSDTTWTENGITWSNRPTLGTTLASYSLNTQMFEEIEVDVTNFIQAEKTAGRNVVTLAISSPNVGAKDVRLGSRESEWGMPELVIAQKGVNSSAFVSQSVPTTMTAGQTYTVSVTMQNTGTTTWTSANQYGLGAQNPHDNNNWGTNRIPLPATTAPGANVTFSWSVTAPSTPGTYNFQWKLVQDGLEWFGVLSTNVSVNVLAQNAKAYEFNTAGNYEGWNGANQMTTSVSGGLLNMTVSGTDPFIWSPGTLGVSAANYPYVKIKMSNGTSCPNAKLYFITDADQTWNEAKTVVFTTTANSGLTEYVINMSANSNWTGTIRQMRFDPVGGSYTGNSITVDYIRISR